MTRVRASKAALARAAELLGTSPAEAREYMRRIQAHAGHAVPYADIVAAMEAGDPRDEAAVAARAAR